MVKFMPPPANMQDRVAYDYLYQLQEYLKVSLANLGSGIGGESAELTEDGNLVSTTTGGAASSATQSQYDALRALIIKTADDVETQTQIDISGLRELLANLDALVVAQQATLVNISQNYLALSDFGIYQESIAQQISVLGSYIQQQISMVTLLQADVDQVSADFYTWITETQGYIRFGIVGERDDVAHTPIIGIAIGQDLKVMVDANGEEVTTPVTLEDGRVIECVTIKQESFRAIYAADELSFWNGPVKIAYMNGNRLYITNVVALASLQIGSWNMKDDGVNGLTLKWIGG